MILRNLIHRLRRLLQPPVFQDEETTRRAGLLHVILVIGLGLILLQLFSSILNRFAYAELLPVQAALLISYLAMLALLYAGKLNLAAVLTLMCILLGTTIILVQVGSITAAVSGVYLLTIVVAGLILPQGVGLAVTGITTAVAIFLVWAEALGWMGPAVQIDPLTRSITYAGMYAAAAGVVLLARRQSDRLLDVYRAELAKRRRVESALHASQARLLGLLAAVPDYIFIADVQGMYHDVFTIDEAGLGIPIQSVCGRTVFELHTPEQAQAFLEVLQRACATQEVIDYEYALALGAATGERRWYQARVVAFEAPEGRRILWLARETSEARRAARALEQLTADLEQRVQERTARLEEVNRELEAFAYSVSHDLRAPLRAVNSYARLLAEDYGPNLPEDAQQMLANLRQGAAQMDFQIDELLRLERVANLPLHRRPVCMRRIAESATHTLLAGCTDRKIHVEIEDMPPAEADPTLLERVYTNLLDNALKYTRPRAETCIQVGALRPETSAETAGASVFYVRDNGIGFDMSAAGSLFAAFQRIHTDPSYEGSGLGLAITRRIVERHGGRIWTESHPDQGATFYFTLWE